MPTSSHSTANYCIARPLREALFLPQLFILGKLPGRGLEPLRISPPDPKSGASANSATPASLISKDLTISLSSRNAFVLEFVLELWYEWPCNAKKSRLAAVDTPPLGQRLCLAIIAPSLSPHATLAIAESLDFISAATATTRSFGLMSETAKKHRGVFRFATATINRSKLFQARVRRLKSSDMTGAKISCRRWGINRSFAIIAPPILRKQKCNESAPTQLPASGSR